MAEAATGTVTVTSLSSVFPSKEAHKAARRIEDAISERRKEVERMKEFIADNAGLISLVQKLPDKLHRNIMASRGMISVLGGEMVNSWPSGSRTGTQMEGWAFRRGKGFGRASYFRNLQVVDGDNNPVPLSNLQVPADHPECYDIQGGTNRVSGNYFHYGGPGRNVRCP